MVYALYDWTAKKENPGYGFANTKKAIAFSNNEKRVSFISERKDYDFSAKNITRKEAMKMLETLPNSRDKGLQIDDPNEYNFITLRESKY